MWIREIHEYDEQNAEQVELKLCPNPKTTMIKYFQVFSSIFKYFLKSPKKRIIRVCLNRIESMSLLCPKLVWTKLFCKCIFELNN